MSRTYRRQKGYVPRYVKEAAEPLAIHECWGYDVDFWAQKKYSFYHRMDYRDGQWFYRNPKELEQCRAYWFGDHGYAWRRTYGKDTRKWARIETQRKYRAEARQELVRFKQNSDYEVQIPRKNLLPWD